ncbi:YchJ family protein [Sphingobacterium paludis]|nr:YchJ family metal-binding protein [Sphingobacterium paludis]
MVNCNCGSARFYADCCLLVHQDRQAAITAEQLMRARYTAFTRSLIDFLYDSFHPDSRRYQNKKEIAAWAQENKWMHLEIIQASTTTVEFKAHYLDKQFEPAVHHEKSRFKKDRGIWYYLDGRLLS